MKFTGKTKRNDRHAITFPAKHNFQVSEDGISQSVTPSYSRYYRKHFCYTRQCTTKSKYIPVPVARPHFKQEECQCHKCSGMCRCSWRAWSRRFFTKLLFLLLNSFQTALSRTVLCISWPYLWNIFLHLICFRKHYNHIFNALLELFLRLSIGGQYSIDIM